MTFANLKAKLKEEFEKSKRIHKDYGSMQIPTTRGGTGNIQAGAGPMGSGDQPREVAATPEEILARKGSDSGSGSTRHDQR